MRKAKFTNLQERFVYNILKGMNQTDAYLEAGYKCTRSVARRNAARLMTNADILKAIKKAQKKAAYNAELTAERILREEMCLAYLDPGRLIDKSGKLLPLNKLPEDVRRAVAGVEVISQPKGKLKYRYRFCDKGKSLDRLERIEGLFAPEKHEIAGKDGGPIEGKMTHFPSGPLTLAEWEKQVKELNEQEKTDNQPVRDSSDDVLATSNRTAKAKKIT